MFAGCWITEDEGEERGVVDTLFWYLDRIVISSKSFPMKVSVFVNFKVY